MPHILPLDLPAMEATSVAVLPSGAEWQYEPKWDGFRCLVFRDGDDVELRSKAGQPLGRYFPEIVEQVRQLAAPRFVLDGELVVPAGAGLSFDALLQRVHPAASRVRKLSADTPAWYVVFDLLAESRTRWLERPLATRREALEAFAAREFGAVSGLRLSPATRSGPQAEAWFGAGGESLDGIIAKRVDASYAAGGRGAMVKIKARRTADCVVGGFRYGEKARVVASLLLGLYDEAGRLHHVGFCSGLTAAERPALTAKLERLRGGTGFTGRAPGGPSRWSSKRSTEWEPLQPSLVVEVQFDHVTGQRFRHGTALLRWRPDKRPDQCTFEQLAQTSSAALALISPPARRARSSLSVRTRPSRRRPRKA